MNLVMYCPIWGMMDQDLERVLLKIKNAGYDGAEIPINPDIHNLEAIDKLFKKLDLRMLIQHPFAVGTNAKDFQKDFITKLEKLTVLRPDKINCQTGKDYFSVANNIKILEAAHKIEASTGIEIVHEIHRGRFSFSTLLIQEYLKQVPCIKYTADFSHWCVVSSSLLEEQEHIMNMVIPSCTHIHARVGTSHSPQATHPNAPENKYALERHLSWWKKIYNSHLEQNKSELSVTCEFGPVPYLPTLPFTNQPVSNQWEMNIFMKDLLIKEFKKWRN